MSRTTRPSRLALLSRRAGAYPPLAPTPFDAACETVARYDHLMAHRLAAYQSLGLDILTGANRDDFLVAVLCGDDLAAREAASPSQRRVWGPLKAALDDAVAQTFSTAKGSRERIAHWIEIGGLANVVRRVREDKPTPPAPR